MNPNLSIVIPWCNRPELLKSLASNVPIARKTNLPLIIVNCGGDPEQLSEITSRIPFDGQIIQIERATFSRALALNCGFHFVSTPYVSFLDSDIILNGGYLSTLLPRLSPDCVITVYKVSEADALDGNNRPEIPCGHVRDVLQKQVFEVVWKDGSLTSVTAQHRFARGGGRGGPGLISVSVEAFRSVGGFNSQFVGWGFEDVDLRFRLIRALGLRHVLHGEVTHLSHSDSSRDLQASSRFETNRRNIERACEQYNLANFQGTLTTDIETTMSRLGCPPRF